MNQNSNPSNSKFNACYADKYHVKELGELDERKKKKSIPVILPGF